MATSAHSLALALDVADGRLVASLTNRGDRPVRVWERTNSWGWAIFSLTVHASGSASRAFTLRPASRVWTRNGPSFVEIAPGESHAFGLAPSEEQWEGITAAESLRDQPLEVVATLKVPDSTEAREFDVFIGSVESAPLLVQPPHRWLFGNAS
jgi:hypothetical protein